jgi:hypothetical protein
MLSGGMLDRLPGANEENVKDAMGLEAGKQKKGCREAGGVGG